MAGLSGDQQLATLSCVLLKKYFLDWKSTANLSEQVLNQLKSAVEATLDIESQPMSLLKPKGDVLSKIYAKLEKKSDFLMYLAALS